MTARWLPVLLAVMLLVGGGTFTHARELAGGGGHHHAAIELDRTAATDRHDHTGPAPFDHAEDLLHCGSATWVVEAAARLPHPPTVREKVARVSLRARSIECLVEPPPPRSAVPTSRI